MGHRTPNHRFPPGTCGCVGDLVTAWLAWAERAATHQRDDVASESDYLRHLEQLHQAESHALQLCCRLRERTRDLVASEQAAVDRVLNRLTPPG